MRSLRARTIFWALVPTVLVLIIVAVIALVAYERALRGVAEDWNAELARASAARLSEGVSHYSRLLEAVAAGEDVRSMQSARIGEALDEAHDRLGVFDLGLVVYDAAGVGYWMPVNVLGILWTITLPLLVLGALALVGGVFALQRRRWGWALAGSIAAFFPFGLLGLLATIFTAMSKEEFES